jgi:hypothetical protein
VGGKDEGEDIVLHQEQEHLMVPPQTVAVQEQDIWPVVLW